MEIQCPNPECRAGNPANAKFCRKCGTALTHTNQYGLFLSKVFTRNYGVNAETFTLDTFRSISFLPVSVVKIQFVNVFVVSIFVASMVICFLTERYYIDDLLYLYEYHELIILVCLVLSGLSALFIVKCWIRKLRYKYNADYIEDSFIDDKIVRIARKSRVGLFDKGKKQVLLSSSYSAIEKFDDQDHLLISKGERKGLYSLKYRKIIIPVLYDSISRFENSVASADLQGTEHHYDVKGNKLR